MMIVSNDREYFHPVTYLPSALSLVRQWGAALTQLLVTRCHDVCHVTEASMEALCHALCHAGPHYVTECQMQTSHLHPGAEMEREQETNQP